MNLASCHVSRRILLFPIVLGLAACATGLPEVQPIDIPRLEQEIAASPDDLGLQVQLGMAQFKDLDYEAARGTLQAAVDAGDASGAALLYLGMAQEELEDWSAARDSYARYLEEGASVEARSQVRKRLSLIARNILRAEAQQALARETEITRTGATTPGSVAVLPMAFNSNNAELEPLIYALSDMMVTDFKLSNALIVLERAQIQTLLDEMALTSSGYAEPGTGARTGRLLRAEHVFQGVLTTLGDNDLQTVADILNVPSASSAGTLTETAVLESLFDMEKQIVIRSIREVLAVELTPAEEQAILDNRISNVLAFIAYGRGLRELDQGNYEAAQSEFALALSLEPGAFPGAQLALSETEALIDATATSTADLAGTAAGTETGLGIVGPPPASTTTDLTALGISDQPVAGTTGGQSSGSVTLNTLRNLAEGVDPTPTAGTLDLGSAGQSQGQTTQQTTNTTRDPVQEGIDTSVTSTTLAVIRIVIMRPGGDQ